jgi:hypothetical protein
VGGREHRPIVARGPLDPFRHAERPGRRRGDRRGLPELVIPEDPHRPGLEVNPSPAEAASPSLALQAGNIIRYVAITGTVGSLVTIVVLWVVVAVLLVGTRGRLGYDSAPSGIIRVEQGRPEAQ